MNSKIIQQDPHDFHPEIVQIEKDLLNFLEDGMVNVSGRDPIVSKVMSTFYTRKNLTQQDLQKLTKYSAGTISKTVRQLIDMKVIIKELIPGTHKHIYRMEKLPYGSPAYIFSSGQMIEGVSDELKEILNKLEENKENMDDLDGFDRVYSIASQLSTLMTSVPKFMAILEKELEEYMRTQ